MARLRRGVTERQSQFTKASKAYTEATGIQADERTIYQPEPKRIPTDEESRDLSLELQRAQTIFLKNNTVEDDEDLENIYSTYEEVLVRISSSPRSELYDARSHLPCYVCRQSLNRGNMRWVQQGNLCK
jgi:hypothetical protein